jgi:hypothetical protein
MESQLAFFLVIFFGGCLAALLSGLFGFQTMLNAVRASNDQTPSDMLKVFLVICMTAGSGFLLWSSVCVQVLS